MALEKYRSKRDFRRTAEPRGRAAKRSGSLYVIQKHDASHLHYDFRLQIGGVLKSWAVPKGPSLDPRIKRLAMHVEDHPLEYGAFEGTIPEDQYGGGTVMLWDRGTWQAEGDAEKGFRAGKLHFRLHGQKLRGEWVLVRRAAGSPSDGHEAWLLFKVRDDEARDTAQGDVLEEEPLSVASGRTLEEIAAASDRVWNSTPKATAKSTRGTAHRQSSAQHKHNRQKLHRLLEQVAPGDSAKLPRTFRPQLATLIRQAPRGDQWLNEIKFDGYRMICRVEHDKVSLASRNGLDWTERLPHLVQAVRGLGLAQALLDGEVVALQNDGTTSFQAMQNAFKEGRAGQLVYYVFDLLYLNGHNLSKVALEDRKRLLAALLEQPHGPLRYSEHVIGTAPELFRQASKRHLEGIICKRRDRPYRAGRSADWLKVKCVYREEFVIGGYTPPSGSRHGFGALLVGYHDSQGRLIYAGRVGTGFSQRILQELAVRLESLTQQKSPFDNLREATGVNRRVRWVKPRLVAQTEFRQWTHDGIMRQPSFQGLREDKTAAEVVLERPVSANVLTDEKSTKASSRKARRKRDPATSATSATTAPPAVVDSRLPASVRLTHPDKVMYPDVGITKAQLASYYAAVASWMLPHLHDRPLVLVRCPEGQHKTCFFQKHAGAGVPEQLRRVPIVEQGKSRQYVMADDVAGLLSLVQMSALEIHVWGSRADKLELPDRLVFDLDPAEGVPWPRVIESAQQLRRFFDDLELAVFLKTTGGKGLHLVVPIQRRHDWETIRRFCRAIAEHAAQADPTRYTATMSKSARTGRIFIDYLRNARGATAVAPYSTRARPGAPVSTPIRWDELHALRAPNQYTVLDVPQRIAALKADPWQELLSTRQSITKSMLTHLGVT